MLRILKCSTHNFGLDPSALGRHDAQFEAQRVDDLDRWGLMQLMVANPFEYGVLCPQETIRYLLDGLGSAAVVRVLNNLDALAKALFAFGWGPVETGLVAIEDSRNVFGRIHASPGLAASPVPASSLGFGAGATIGRCHIRFTLPAIIARILQDTAVLMEV